MTEGGQAPAGWYPHPSMADTLRYWDGSRWTDHIQAVQESRRRPFNDNALRRVATLIGLAFLAPILVLTFTEPTANGINCGTWLDPEFDTLGLTDKSLELARRGATAADLALLDQVAADCQDALSVRRTIVLALLAVGVGCRFAIPAIARAIRE